MTDERIEKAIQQTGAKLIILDPIQAYIGANVDMHRANEIRPVMSKLGRIAEEYGAQWSDRTHEQSRRIRKAHIAG